jgi:hypothetical protein
LLELLGLQLKLVQIFLPRYDNNGRRFAPALYARERDRLVERFGGLTAYTQNRAHGLWKDHGRTHKDAIIIFEVLVRPVDRKWWMAYRRRLQRRFRQKELLVRVQDTKIL